VLATAGCARCQRLNISVATHVNLGVRMLTHLITRYPTCQMLLPSLVTVKAALELASPVYLAQPLHQLLSTTIVCALKHSRLCRDLPTTITCTCASAAAFSAPVLQLFLFVPASFI
jgi:hypothetical protein